MKILFIIFSILFFQLFAIAQIDHQFGIKISLSQSLSHASGDQSTFEYRVIGGVIFKYNIKDFFSYCPSLQIGIAKGSIGYDAFHCCKNKLEFEVFVAPFNLVFHTDTKSKGMQNALYTLNNNFLNNNFFNDKECLFQIGTQYLFHKIGTDNSIQQIGNAQARIFNLQAGYYNDGIPFNWVKLSDGYDRWNTGGGYISFITYHTNRFITCLGWEFQKYTGYVKGAFEASDLLSLEYTIMKDKNEIRKFSNINRFYIRALKEKHLVEISLNLKDVKNDIQDYIHKTITLNPVFLNKSFKSNNLNLIYSGN